MPPSPPSHGRARSKANDRQHANFKEHAVPLRWSHSIDKLDWVELAALYQAAPLGNKNPVDLEIAFTNSMFKCFVRDQGKLIGVGRALADGVDCSYICDVALLPSHPGRGLGKQIVSELVSLSSGHKKVILYSVPGREPFYKKLGFRRMRTAMAIFESPGVAFERGYIDET
jgi:ribosomal protein S18 acetylase RimI-like enzyme